MKKLDLAECHCRCGAVYSSHAKVLLRGKRFRAVSMIPCPACGAEANLHKVSYPAETYALGDKR